MRKALALFIALIAAVSLMALVYLPSSPSFTSPLEVGSTLKVWLRAESLALSDGATVASWTDLSGNANHAVQSTEANKPIYKVSRLNGLASVQFVDSTDNMKTASGIIAMNAAKSLFVVYRNAELTASNAVRPVVGEGDTEATNNWFYIIDTFGTTLGRSPGLESYGSTLNSNIIAGPGFWKIASASYAGGASGATRLFYDSSMTTSTYSGTGNSDGLRLGYAPGGYSFTGDIAEVIYCDTQLSLADHLKMIRYLQRQYGIQ